MRKRKFFAGVLLLSFILMARYQVPFLQSLEWTRMFVVNLREGSVKKAFTVTVAQTHSCQICRNIWLVLGSESKKLTKIKSKSLSIEPFAAILFQRFILKTNFLRKSVTRNFLDLICGAVPVPPPELRLFF
ncbi:MAG: hypothetical protein M1169_06840 [Firmicutes bacterium]|nr:hypothetical protein [Bacillota bacterium]